MHACPQFKDSLLAMKIIYNCQSGLPPGNDKIRGILSTAENFVLQKKKKIILKKILKILIRGISAYPQKSGSPALVNHSYYQLMKCSIENHLERHC